jgi:hypothetical protein
LPLPGERPPCARRQPLAPIHPVPFQTGPQSCWDHRSLRRQESGAQPVTLRSSYWGMALGVSGANPAGTDTESPSPGQTAQLRVMADKRR